MRSNNDKQSQKNRPGVHLHYDWIISGDGTEGPLWTVYEEP